MYFIDIDQIPTKVLPTGVTSRVITGEHVQLSFAHTGSGDTPAPHSHPNEQVGVVLKGSYDVRIGDEVRTVKTGDVFFIPGGVEHGVVVMHEESLTLDVFGPPRPEYA